MYTQKAATMKKNHCCARKPGSLRSACACRASVKSSLTISVCGGRGKQPVAAAVQS